MLADIINKEVKGLIFYITISYLLAYTIDYIVILPNLIKFQNEYMNPQYFLTIGALVARMWTPTISVLLTLKVIHHANPLEFLKSPSLKDIHYKQALLISIIVLLGYIVAIILALISGAHLGECGYYKFLNPFVIVGEITLGIILGVYVNSPVALGEEIGWRGYMYTIIRKRYNLLWTSIIIGVIWGFWHAPLILSGYNYVNLIPGCNSHSRSQATLGVFIIYTVAASILLTEVRENTRSIYSSAVGHGVINGVAPRMSLLVNGNTLIAPPAGLSASVGLLFAAAVWKWWFRSG
ncbi:MAG: CPBP family intramembrane metalloprotease [Desulfurococcales archaeon]|nr:CPBP family intramembrane metalloprotease [Desulfurococcales archaeon]